MLDVLGFAPALARATLVITGEGSLDEQTLHGKAPAGVAAAARAAGMEVVAVCGRLALPPEALGRAGHPPGLRADGPGAGRGQLHRRGGPDPGAAWPSRSPAIFV